MSFIHYVMSLTHDRMQNCNDSIVIGDTLLLYVNYFIMYWLFLLAVHDFRWCHVDFCPTCPRVFPYVFCSLHFSYLVLSCLGVPCLVLSFLVLVSTSLWSFDYFYTHVLRSRTWRVHAGRSHPSINCLWEIRR